MMNSLKFSTKKVLMMASLASLAACSTTGKMPPPTATYQLQKSPLSSTEINAQIKQSIETVERQKQLLAQTKRHNPPHVSPQTPYPVNQAQYATDPSGVQTLTHKQMREIVRTGQTNTRPDNYDPIQEDGVSAGHLMTERIKDFQFERGLPQDVSPSLSMTAISLSKLAQEEPKIPVRSFGNKSLTNQGLTSVRLDDKKFFRTETVNNTNKNKSNQFAKAVKEQSRSAVSLNSEIRLSGKYDVKDLIKEIAGQIGYQVHISGYDNVPEKYRVISFASGYTSKVATTLENLHNSLNTAWQKSGNKGDLVNMEIFKHNKTMNINFKGGK